MDADQSKNMFGDSNWQENSKTLVDIYDGDIAMAAMSILSDAQHAIKYHGDSGIEKARQYINKAKFLLDQLSSAHRQAKARGE